MLVFIHTITLVHEEFQLSTRFYHAIQANIKSRKIQSRLLGKKVALYLRRKPHHGHGLFKRRPCGRLNARHDVETIKIDATLSGSTSPRGYLVSTLPPCPPKDNSTADRSIEKVPSPLPLLVEHNTHENTLGPVTSDWTKLQVAQWLRINSFDNYVSTFANFSGADVLRLTKDDLVQICGLADGIRLHHVLHARAIAHLTLYICTPGSNVYHAVFLDQMRASELNRKVAAVLGVHLGHIHDVYIQGPSGIRVLLTDQVISYMKDESIFMVELLKLADPSRERLILLIKPTTPNAP